jgi:outer membrane receptor protein involved in Fe transport
VCASFLNGTDPNCVPYDIWRLGGVTGAALQYLQIPLLANGSTQQQVQGGTLSADLGNYGIKTPWAKDGVGFVFGLERRKEKLVLETDTNFSSGDGAGQGGATIGRSGKVTVNEWFTEARVPIIEGRPWADLLSVNGAYRHSNYNTGVKTKTYALGAEWAPIRQYRFRGSYQRAVRAANINELFLAQGNNLFDQTGDPCGPAALAAANTPALLAALQAACARTGLAAAQIGNPLLDSPAGQFNFLQGGNPQLRPEEADTYTAGVVFNPIRNLTGSLDWWSISIDGAIGNAPPTTILQQCFNNNQFCNLVQRDAFGTLWLLPAGRVVALNDNLGGYKTTGVDLALNYLQRIGRFGSLNFNYNGSWLDKWEFEPIKGLGKFDCAGFVGPQCGFPLPKYRHKARVTWTTPWNVDLAATWRHIGKVQNETLSGDPDLSGATLNTDRELASRDYLDLAFSWVIDKSLTVRGGVNNVFDKDPPIISSVFAGPAIFGNGNTFPGTYDTLGRTIFIGLTAKW